MPASFSLQLLWQIIYRRLVTNKKAVDITIEVSDGDTLRRIWSDVGDPLLREGFFILLLEITLLLLMAIAAAPTLPGKENDNIHHHDRHGQVFIAHFPRLKLTMMLRHR